MVTLLALLAGGSWIGVQLSVSEITPPERLALGGYTERRGALFERGGDLLHVRTLVLEGEGQKVIIASVEMLTIPESLCREVLAKLDSLPRTRGRVREGARTDNQGGTGASATTRTPSPALPHRSGSGGSPTYASILPRMEAHPRKNRPPSPTLPNRSGGGGSATTQVWLVATHTHCAPDSQMLNERMTFAIPGIASYRRRWLEWYSDAIARLIRDALDAPQSRYPVLFLKEFQAHLNRPRRPNALPNTLAGELLAPGNRPLLAQFAAHATFYGADERRLRGDWPGEMADVLCAPVLPGAIGDVSPDADGKNPKERIKNFVTTFKNLAARTKAGEISPMPFATASTPIRLPRPAPHPEFAKRNGLPQPLAESLNERFAPPEAQVVGVRVGKLAIVGIPGEPTAEIGRQIMLAGRGMGFSSVWVISHVNGWIGYILTPDDYARGGYEATLSFYGPETGPQVVDAARKTLRALRDHASPS